MTATTPAPRLRIVSDGRQAIGRGRLLSLVVAAGVVAFAIDNGASEVTSRSVAAIVASWAILLAVAFALWPRAPVPRAAIACGIAFAAFALFAGLSALWAPSAERAFVEFDRIALHLALFAIAVLATRPGDARRWADGLALGIAIVGALALAQRLLPELLPETDIPRLLPAAGTRLSYPLGYWNGLGIFLALGLPLLLRTAVAARHAAARGLALVPVPVIGAAMYLTSSRGGVAAAVVALAVFLLCGPRRFAALLAVAVGVAGAAMSIAVVDAHPALVDGTPGSDAAVDEGPGVMASVLAISAFCGAAYAGLTAIVPVALRLPRPAAAAAAAVALVAAVVALAAADPVERFETFKEPPAAAEFGGVRGHLFSGAGSGRWQFWDAAVEQWRDHPVTGDGAGSFEAWWAQHGSIDWFVRNAHSLWLETLGELGLVGFLLLAGGFLVALAAGASRLRRRTDEDRSAVAALVAVVVAFAVGAAIDWVWQVPAIAAVAVVALGLLAGPATLADGRVRPGTARRRFGARAAVVLLAWAAILAQALPLLVANEIDASQEAVIRGDLAEAYERADSARAIQPWAASPYVQLALLREEEGDLAAARRHIADAAERDEADWRIRLIAARLATKAGDIRAARGALREARRLNPRSPALRRPQG